MRVDTEIVLIEATWTAIIDLAIIGLFVGAWWIFGQLTKKPQKLTKLFYVTN